MLTGDYYDAPDRLVAGRCEVRRIQKGSRTLNGAPLETWVPATVLGKPERVRSYRVVRVLIEDIGERVVKLTDLRVPSPGVSRAVVA